MPGGPSTTPPGPNSSTATEGHVVEEGDEVSISDVSHDEDILPFQGFSDDDVHDPRDRLDSLTASIRARMGSQDDQDLAASHKLEYERIKDDFEDEFMDLNFNDVPMALKNKYVLRLESDKEHIRKIVTFFKSS